MIRVTRLTTMSSSGNEPYTACVKDTSSAVAPPTSAAPPGRPARRSRNLDTIAFPSARLPSARGITVSNASDPRRNDELSALMTACTPGVSFARAVA